MSTGFVLSLFVSLGFVSSVLSELQPALPFENHGVCPFECCVYRTWTIESDTDVFAERKDGSPVVFRLSKGGTVQALTGVVVTKKLGVATVRTELTLGTGEQRHRVRPGDTVYISHYEGEGYWKYWFRGSFGSDQIPDIDERCSGPTQLCGIQISQRPDTVWWVKLRNDAGVVGWTRQVDHFGNNDACS